jgi:TrmH family RNA methyltransferase
MITSSSNPRIQSAQRVRDGRDDGFIFVEGERLVEELAASELSVQLVFHGGSPTPRTAALVSLFETLGVECQPCAESVLKALSATVQPQGIVAIAHRPQPLPLDHFLSFDNPLILVLDAVQDPGNVGTMLRTAEAAGVTGVIALRGTAYPLSPKVLRSAMGSAFRLPVVAGITEEHLLNWAKATGIRLIAAAADSAAPYSHEVWHDPCALIMGNEATGVATALLKAATQRVFIPMHSPVESLNVAAATAVLLFEAARQRRVG